MASWLIQEIFKSLDTDKSGTMSSHEMRDAASKAGNFNHPVPLLSRQSTECFPKVSGIIKMFLAKVKRAFVLFLVGSGFLLGTLSSMLFLHSLFLIVGS